MAKTFKRIKEKIADAKEKINVPKPVKRALVGAAIVGSGAIIGGVAKQYFEHQENEKINTEWKKQFQDADSVVADAKTAHFYASKKLSDDDVWQKRLYLRDLERAKIELQKVQLAEQAQELEDKFNLELQKDLGNAIQEGNLQKIDKALERGAVVRQLEILIVSDPKALFRPKKNALEVMEHIFDKYDENINLDVDDLKFQESKFWGYVVADLEKRSAEDSAWSGFYDKAKQKLTEARAEEERLENEFREKLWKGEIEYHYYGEYLDKINGNIEAKVPNVNLGAIGDKYFKRLYPKAPVSHSLSSVDDQMKALDLEIQATKDVIESGHEYEIEAKAGENLRVESDVLQSYQGKHMRKEKADSLRNAEEPAAMKQQKRVDTIKVKDLEKGVSWTVETTTTFSSGTSLKGAESPTHSDSGNQVKEQLQKRKNIKKQYIDNER